MGLAKAKLLIELMAMRAEQRRLNQELLKWVPYLERGIDERTLEALDYKWVERQARIAQIGESISSLKGG